MAIRAEEGTFFRKNSVIRYLTVWDQLFANLKSGFKFYRGSPEYVVNVCRYGDTDKLTEQDVIVYYGKHHNHANIETAITELSQDILEIAKKVPEMEFALDLQTLEVLSSTSFTDTIPATLNSMFVLFGQYTGVVYSLVNPTNQFKDEDFYWWFVTFIQASRSCLLPYNEVTKEAKQMLQVIISNKYDGKTHYVKDPALLTACLGDAGVTKFNVPGSIDRLTNLFNASIEQISNKKAKKKR